MELTKDKVIAVLGGTGNEGKGLAYRWAAAGYKVIIGSRTEEKALNAAADVTEMIGKEGQVSGLLNELAAEAADIAVLTVPFKAHRPTLEGLVQPLQGKILVDVTVPLVPPRVSTVQMPPAGSAAQEAREILGKDVQVVAAFQNISHEHLFGDGDIECDVLVCGSKAARPLVVELVEAAGMVGWEAGPIQNAVVVEGLTSILIGLNKKYGVKSSGIKMTGLPRKS